MTPRDPRWPSDGALDPEEHAPDTSGYALVRTPPRPRRSTFRTMETVLLASTAALLAAVAWPIATGGQSAPPTPVAAAPPAAAIQQAPKIQLALLLDTSSSMDGLLDQARSQLWAVVNALDSATFQGAAPQLEIAVYEYGNDGLAESDGYIRQVVGFSGELDLVSEGLFGLTTSGGDEFAGQVISAATRELKWDERDNVLRVLYIAGNEEFTQGPMDFHETVAAARSRGIVVNTVNCTGRGNWDPGWQDAARLGGGKALRIDHNAKQAYIASPHDDEIESLSSKLNDTYIGFGYRAKAALDNQARQDKNSVSAGRTSSIARAMSKTSGMYNNAKWDLVDALDEGTVELGTLDRSTLLHGYSALSDEELEQKVTDARNTRDQLKKDLRELQEQREAYVATQRTQGGHRLDHAIIDSISAQAAAAGFTL
ncbi:MAG: vWA domain-containing protein [Nannocystales bacterium]